jgi:hypothetical protein
MLHYKYLGFDYLMERNRVLAPGLRPRDLKMRWGAHYLRTETHVANDFARIRSMAEPVPALAGDAEAARAGRDNEITLRRSGLFQSAFYLARNQDVSSAGFDPLLHYHLFGWREGRRPNPHFDPLWYASAYAEALNPAIDPLLDYVVRGERVGRKPCQSFDPGAYRRAHGISENESPLRHFLNNQDPRLTGLSVLPPPVRAPSADIPALGG